MKTCLLVLVSVVSVFWCMQMKRPPESPGKAEGQRSHVAQSNLTVTSSVWDSWSLEPFALVPICTHSCACVWFFSCLIILARSQHFIPKQKTQWLQKYVYWSSLKSRVSLQPRSCVTSCPVPHSCFSPLSTLFWTDWNREAPKIESSSVDGQNRRVVVSDGVGLPNALTFDSSSGQVCWADAGKHHRHCDCWSTASTIIGSK